MKSNKAQQLSINFLVRFILAITVFGLGVILMWNIFGQSTATADLSQTAFDRRIAALNCKPNELVCISTNKFELSAGETIQLDAKVTNSLSQNLVYSLQMQILNSQNAAITNENSELDENGIIVMPAKYTGEQIVARSEKTISFMIITTKELEKGQYVARLVASRDAPGSSETLPAITKRVTFTVS